MVSPSNIGRERRGTLFVPVPVCDVSGYMEGISSGVAAEGVAGNGELVDIMLRPPHLIQRMLSPVAVVGDDLFLCRGWNR
jgi:hypothetical protein